MKRTLSLVLALVIMLSCAVFFAGCSQEDSKNYPVTVDGVTIEKEPEAIVILNDCLADVVSYIGYDYKMVGRSIECDQEFLSIVPSVGTPDNPAVDTIINKGADLVIADSTLNEKSRSALAEAGITVLTLAPATNKDKLKTLYSELGAALGGDVTGRNKGEKAFGDLFGMLEQFKTATTGVIKTAAYLYLDSEGLLCTFTKGSFEQLIFDYNGAMNTFSNQEEPAIDPTELRLGSPTCIFYDDENVPEYLMNDENLCKLKALNYDRLCCIPLKAFGRQGATIEQIVYTMIDFLNSLDEATPDEATPDESAKPTESEDTDNDTDEDNADSDGSYDGSYTEDGEYDYEN